MSKKTYRVHFPQVNARWITVKADNPTEARRAAEKKWNERPHADYVELDTVGKP